MEHIYQRCAQFADTDAAGVVHFAKILCYAEEAEHDLLAKLDIPLLADGGWPRVKLSCEYTKPVQAGDVVHVAISPSQLGTSSIVWRFSMNCKGNEIANGEMKTVRVDAAGKPSQLKESWREALGS
ncbi:MAG: thioesterase family protein [Akkermansiaceae bacterium]|nr:thioesterase family protein [Akkermansiaceae bacterium]